MDAEYTKGNLSAMTPSILSTLQWEEGGRSPAKTGTMMSSDNLDPESSSAPYSIHPPIRNSAGPLAARDNTKPYM